MLVASAYAVHMARRPSDLGFNSEGRRQFRRRIRHSGRTCGRLCVRKPAKSVSRLDDRQSRREYPSATLADNSPGDCNNPKYPSISAPDPEIGVPKLDTEYAYTGKP
jgi:hypothetical protein